MYKVIVILVNRYIIYTVFRLSVSMFKYCVILILAHHLYTVYLSKIILLYNNMVELCP